MIEMLWQSKSHMNEEYMFARITDLDGDKALEVSVDPKMGFMDRVRFALGFIINPRPKVVSTVFLDGDFEEMCESVVNKGDRKDS